MKEIEVFFKENNIEYLKDEPLKNHSYFEVGGNADYIVFPKQKLELLFVIKEIKSKKIRYYILGNGSNVLFDDLGFKGIIIKTSKLDEFKIDGNTLTCLSGASLTRMSRKAALNSLTGLEFACGIPGTVGGAVTMNAGAYIGEIKDVVKRVDVIDKDLNIISYSNEDMQFSYRYSRVIKESLIVLEIEFELKKGDYKLIWQKIEELTLKRWTKQPIKMPSAGSTFKRPKNGYASKLIEESGLKGLKYKGAMVSDMHSGFIINYDNAKSKDIVTLLNIVKNRVKFETQIDLEPEIKLIGYDDEN